MKQIRLYGCLLVLAGSIVAAQGEQTVKTGDHEFFVFDNGVGRGKWTPQEQAAALKELGYDGISYNYTSNEELGKRIEAFKAVNLKIFGLYCGAKLDKPEQYNPSLKEAFKMLKGSGTVIWWTLTGGKYGLEDDKAVKSVQEIAAIAEENELHVVLYPHKGCYVATASDAARIAKRVNRPNVGASFNLCHEFLTDRGDKVPETLKEVAPYLRLVSINGVDVKNKKYILRLDQGDYDIDGFLGMLSNADYKGPIGLQCYSVPGDQKENLKENISAWRKIHERRMSAKK
ncbi:MAG: hypothetical protein A2283_23530 [Lentisphaerae bacterium RIFOXYA12_FULL_48_11]|nr:MAG: hypothetical protein A2283_23530 [Lentisphaerae bacterium RIFOXYA12_FULL_48_11]